MHHIRAHVVAGSGTDPCGEYFFRRMQVYKVYAGTLRVEACNSDDVAVFALQGRAGEDDSLRASGDLVDGFFAETGEPIPAVGVGEGDSLGHLLDVGFWVELQREQLVNLLK